MERKMRVLSSTSRRVTMPTMHTDTPIPAKRPCRLTFHRVLLAVVLGLAAWWGVGWWLSPRPLYTLRFPLSGPYRLPSVPQAFVIFRVGISEGRELLVLRPNVPVPHQLTLE